MEWYSTIWTVVESIGFLVVIIIFFLDPVRRWNFFGYRPTAVIGLFDPKSEKVLMVEVTEAGSQNDVWAFPQGGMYDDNIQITTRDVLQRELGIDETRFKLLYTQPLGTLRIHDALIIKRSRISTISIFPSLRGKAYMACYVKIRLDEENLHIQNGEGVNQVRAVSIEEAKKMQRSITGVEHNAAKQAMIDKMLDEISLRMKQFRGKG